MQNSVTIATPVDAYIDAPELPTRRGSHISIIDLIEVLKDYYDGQLDRPALPELINQDLLEWHPNSLWCRTDSQQLDRLLSQLEGHECEALRYSLGCSFNEEIITHYYTTRYQGAAAYQEFLEHTAAAAFDYLTELLLQDLNHAPTHR